jgi:hypothetical protein
MVEISKIIEQNPWWKEKEFPFWKYDEHLSNYDNALSIILKENSSLLNTIKYIQSRVLGRQVN